MKRQTNGKPKRSNRTSSQNATTDFTAKFTGRSRQKTQTSRRTPLPIETKNIDDSAKQDSTVSETDRTTNEQTEELNNPSTLENVEDHQIPKSRDAEARPDSPVNPYNKFAYPRPPAEWPGEEVREASVVNRIESLECDDPAESSIDSCCCCPTANHDDGCCKSALKRKEFYRSIKARVSRAVKRHKIFQIRGDIPKLVKALEERGWVEKYETVKTRMVPYGSVASLDSKSRSNMNNADGTLNEKAVIFMLLRHKPPDFIWDCRNDFIEWDTSLRSHVLLNRLQRSYVYTSKLGMAHILRDSHWLFEDGVASVQYPRSYNVSRDPQSFLDDYRITAAVGLLKWFVRRVEKGESFVDLGIDPIPISQLEFAIARCEDFLADSSNRNIDYDVETSKLTTDDQWNLFIDDYSKVLHRGNGIASPRNDETTRTRFEKCFLSASGTLKKLKEIDSQYELNGMRNIWILKPSDLCCGSGINISHNFRDIIRKVESKPKDYFVVQKYIEKPLLVQETKFDIRLWYLVTDTLPLTIWVFEEALLRFSSKPYTFATYHEAIHICNTAIQQKYADESKRRRRRILLGNTNERGESAVVETIRDQEWDCAKLNEYLKTNGYNGEPYHDEIYPKMSQAIVLTMLASQEYMDNRRCSFELYGADFVVTDDLSVWLIEINTNPRMNPPSSRITQRLYEGVLEGLVKVIMDLPLNPAADTGGFKLAYKQNTPTDFQPYLGPCLFVFGKQMTLHEQQDRPARMDKERGANTRGPLGRQHRACTAPPTVPRRRDPKVGDFIDYLNGSRCTVAR